jgi:hypothetical protein
MHMYVCVCSMSALKFGLNLRKGVAPSSQAIYP